jgi:phosphoenolpyruvate synthase/pyruvate phosphate dikinase
MGTEEHVVDLEAIDETQVALVGGKAAHLGALARTDGIRVPAGFCVTTDAFRRILGEAPSIGEQLDALSRLHADDRAGIRALSDELRRTVAAVAVPDDVATAIALAVTAHGERAAYAIRSSATTEDLPTASSAGQQDTYLNVVGPAAVLEHVRRCWASLYTERAVTYRLRSGSDPREAAMAVVVQRMVFPDVAGVLFTADPVTSDRKLVSVEAALGLGEALVAGVADADVFKVRDGRVVARAVATKRLAVRAAPAGGTRTEAIEPEQQGRPALTDAQVVQLARLGRRIEARFGRPQDIEWCLTGDAIEVVQSRPITSLFPVPAADDDEPHVFISVGHQQMMTDPMRPLGLSVHQAVAIPRMYEAGGRLFVDIAARLASPASRARVLEALGKDPLIGDALRTLLDRDDLIPSIPDDGRDGPPAGAAPAPIETDPAIVAGLIERNAASVAALERTIRGQSGAAVFDVILADIQELKRLLSDPLSLQVIMAGIEATWWLNERLEAWLGERNAADALTQSAPGNVTSEMGLALLDVADAIRPYPEVVALLRRVEDEDFLDELAGVPGGRRAHDAIRAFLETYGMRCVGEIDITRPRWSERPSTLVPLILGNVDKFEPGAGELRFEQGRQRAQRAEQELLERVRALPDGERKAGEVKAVIDRVRTFIGYREYPKYGMVRRSFVYKQALVREAERLVRAGVLRERDDAFFLTLQELRDVVDTNQVDDRLIARRKDAFRAYQALTPPRVITSDGEVVAGAYRRDDVPAGALAGVPVSGGTVEGRARVVLDMADADLDADDILVTAYTDPSWTPLFVAIKGLVTEVGGPMTHGAVIAREYGLPAVVGVERATRLIRDGQRIRVHGTDGYVELLPEPASRVGDTPPPNT